MLLNHGSHCYRILWKPEDYLVSRNIYEFKEEILSAFLKQKRESIKAGECLICRPPQGE